MSGSGTMVTLFLRIHSKVFPTYASNSFCSIPRSVSYSRFAIHDATNGAHPTSVSFMKMTPPRDTVAGDASRMFSISRRRRMGGVSGMRSLDARVSVLLSSITVFMLSIHSVSTGPSMVIHLKSGFSSAHASRMHDESVPSVHSRVTRLYPPKSSSSENDFGFTTNACTFSHPGFSAFFRVPCACWRVRHEVVLPVMVRPTSMFPWRHAFASYVWITLRITCSLCCRLFAVKFSLIAAIKSP
mmetsp:Transcript_48479/g.115337  ORF Transcript_48479/g.115337 Transcript_48479/m.115337 type:complete len:242 (-) Transcript_48479:581-1306(-)